MNSKTTTTKNHTIISNINIRTSFQAYDTGKGRKGNGNITELICFLTYSVRLEIQSLNIN